MRILLPIAAATLLVVLAGACTRDVTGLGPSESDPASDLSDRVAGQRTDEPAVTLPTGEPIDGDASGAPSESPDIGDAARLDDAIIRLVGEVIPATPARPTSGVATDVPSELRTVAVVGDSLTVSADAQIRAALAAQGLEVVEVDAAEGRRVARGPVEPGVDAVVDLRIAGADPDLWIVALGTNDVGAQADHETLRADVAEMLRLIPLDAEILWIDMRIEGRPELSVAANSLLRQIAVFDPRVEVVDWHTVAGEEGVLVADGVHLTPTGKERFAATIAAAVTGLMSMTSSEVASRAPCPVSSLEASC